MGPQLQGQDPKTVSEMRVYDALLGVESAMLIPISKLKDLQSRLRGGWRCQLVLMKQKDVVGQPC